MGRGGQVCQYQGGIDFWGVVRFRDARGANRFYDAPLWAWRA